MKFAAGELVVLTTGGPAMLVEDDESELLCWWVEDGTHHRKRFESAELMTLTDWMDRFIDREKERLRLRR